MAHRSLRRFAGSGSVEGESGPAGGAVTGT